MRRKGPGYPVVGPVIDAKLGGNRIGMRPLLPRATGRRIPSFRLSGWFCASPSSGSARQHRLRLLPARRQGWSSNTRIPSMRSTGSTTVASPTASAGTWRTRTSCAYPTDAARTWTPLYYFPEGSRIVLVRPVGHSTLLAGVLFGDLSALALDETTGTRGPQVLRFPKHLGFLTPHSIATDGHGRVYMAAYNYFKNPGESPDTRFCGRQTTAVRGRLSTSSTRLDTLIARPTTRTRATCTSASEIGVLKVRFCARPTGARTWSVFIRGWDDRAVDLAFDRKYVYFGQDNQDRDAIVRADKKTGATSIVLANSLGASYSALRLADGTFLIGETHEPGGSIYVGERTVHLFASRGRHLVDRRSSSGRSTPTQAATRTSTRTTSIPTGAFRCSFRRLRHGRRAGGAAVPGQSSLGAHARLAHDRHHACGSARRCRVGIGVSRTEGRTHDLALRYGLPVVRDCVRRQKAQLRPRAGGVRKPRHPASSTRCRRGLTLRGRDRHSVDRVGRSRGPALCPSPVVAL